MISALCFLIFSTVAYAMEDTTAIDKLHICSLLHNANNTNYYSLASPEKIEYDTLVSEILNQEIVFSYYDGCNCVPDGIGNQIFVREQIAKYIKRYVCDEETLTNRLMDDDAIQDKIRKQDQKACKHMCAGISCVGFFGIFSSLFLCCP